MDKIYWISLLLSQAGETQESAQEPDFRYHVWLAYALVLVLLAGFTMWTVVQVRGAQKRMEHLEERLNRTTPGKSKSAD